MNKILCFAFVLALFSQLAVGQEDKDWPASYLNYISEGENMIAIQICEEGEVKHREIVSPTFGREYYCTGNLHAEGGLKKLKSETVIHAYEGNRRVRYTECVRHGDWKVYFDSTKKCLRSEGAYEDGERDGMWFIYNELGERQYEYEFRKGQLKTKTIVKEDGSRQTTIQRSSGNLFVERNTALLIILGVLPITLIRISRNILTYNKIEGTNYIPGLQDWQKGGTFANLYCTFIFWWLIKADDSEDLKSYKHISNWISIISIFCFVVISTVFIIFGEPTR